MSGALTASKNKPRSILATAFGDNDDIVRQFDKVQYVAMVSMSSPVDRGASAVTKADVHPLVAQPGGFVISQITQRIGAQFWAWTAGFVVFAVVAVFAQRLWRVAVKRRRA